MLRFQRAIRSFSDLPKKTTTISQLTSADSAWFEAALTRIINDRVLSSTTKKSHYAVGPIKSGILKPNSPIVDPLAKVTTDKVKFHLKPCQDEKKPANSGKNSVEKFLDLDYKSLKDSPNVEFSWSENIDLPSETWRRNETLKIHPKASIISKIKTLISSNNVSLTDSDISALDSILKAHCKPSARLLPLDYPLFGINPSIIYELFVCLKTNHQDYLGSLTLTHWSNFMSSIILANSSFSKPDLLFKPVKFQNISENIIREFSKHVKAPVLPPNILVCIFKSALGNSNTDPRKPLKMHSVILEKIKNGVFPKSTITNEYIQALLCIAFRDLSFGQKDFARRDGVLYKLHAYEWGVLLHLETVAEELRDICNFTGLKYSIDTHLGFLEAFSTLESDSGVGKCARALEKYEDVKSVGAAYILEGIAMSFYKIGNYKEVCTLMENLDSNVTLTMTLVNTYIDALIQRKMFQEALDYVVFTIAEKNLKPNDKMVFLACQALNNNPKSSLGMKILNKLRDFVDEAAGSKNNDIEIDSQHLSSSSYFDIIDTAIHFKNIEFGLETYLFFKAARAQRKNISHKLLSLTPRKSVVMILNGLIGRMSFNSEDFLNQAFEFFRTELLSRNRLEIHWENRLEGALRKGKCLKNINAQVGKGGPLKECYEALESGILSAIEKSTRHSMEKKGAFVMHFDRCLQDLQNEEFKIVDSILPDIRAQVSATQ